MVGVERRRSTCQVLENPDLSALGLQRRQGTGSLDGGVTRAGGHASIDSNVSARHRSLPAAYFTVWFPTILLNGSLRLNTCEHVWRRARG